PRPVQIFPVPDNIEPLASVASDPEMNMTMLQILWKHPIEQIKTKGELLEGLKQQLFSALLTNRFEERANGTFAPFSYGFAFKNNQTRSFSAFNLYFYLPADSVLAGLNYGLDELKRAGLHGFSATELERAKRSLIRELENTLAEADKQESEWKTWEYRTHFLSGEIPMSAIQLMQLLQEALEVITLPDVNSMHAKLVTDKNMVINVMTSERPDKQVVTEAEILAAIAKNRASQLLEYTDKFRDEPLLKDIPAPRSILGEEIYPATGIKRWTLANGAFVYLKPTQNRNDELLMRAFSPGGESSFSKEDFLQGSWAANLVRECGVGSFDKNELTKTLADKIVRVVPYITRCSEGFYGTCSPVDMETMFQLTYLYANQPNVDEAGYASWINKQSTFIRDQELDPESCFQDSIQVISRNHHPRAHSLNMEILQGIDRAKAVALYRERFQANPGDFVYIFVGNFDEETLKRNCMTYLSGGKLRKDWEAIKDDGMRYKAGKDGLVLHKGIADKALVRLVTYNDGPVTAETRQETAMLEVLASEKLRENIRENRSGVYYVYCYADKDSYPVQELSAYLGLGCSSDRVDELIDASLAVLDSLKAGLFEDKYVNTVKQTRLKQMEENLQSNDWWAERILDQVSNQFPVDAIMDEVDAIKAIDKDKLAAYARKYMNFDENCLKFVLLPEVAKR
ncbi:MAG: insulinase family protein, partial [Candidatus Cloacimonas sp.]|nr:insulinase family protein [Candidatus Cloacimonas sp.]